jgi:mannose-1-phosphate guanylyltransferase
MADIQVVIMAGGIGSRLWPLSTPDLPKQFVDVLGIGKTLIQMTVDRFLPVCPADNMWVVTSEHYEQIVREQLPDIPSEHILLEPVGRNTAPCIAYACRKIREHHPDAAVVVTPSDALVMKKDRFKRIIAKAIDFVNESAEARIVTIGIEPSRPETGYGYIRASKAVRGKIVKVRQFCEKPDFDTAVSYISSGNYFWNAGIFVWKVSTILSELKAHAAQITAVMDKLQPYFYTPQEQEKLQELFPTCDKISIDYAVMEKSRHIYVIAEDLGWSDLGTWGSLKKFRKNVGSIELHDCENCMCAIEDGQRLIAVGLKDYIIAVKDGRILVCPLDREQEIKKYV